MVRFVRQVLGVLLGGTALGQAYYAMGFRLEDSGELMEIERMDFVLGGAVAVAFFLFFGPSRFVASKEWFLTIAIAVMIWTGVSGALIWSHREQHRGRFGQLDVVPFSIRRGVS